MAGLSVAGCADIARVTSITPEPLAANSAVAAQVKTATRTNYSMPSFRNVPPKPTDVPAPATYRAAVAESKQARAQVETWIAANPPMVVLGENETEAFAAGQRARIPAGEMTTPAPAGSEEYAARLRALATPPPPPK
ncbi:MAG TPA: hypothetical protein VL358_11875 [Caulobacteraceae bacterium]|nr:hypothetical protein [Caulobacteraceae bacterium]